MAYHHDNWIIDSLDDIGKEEKIIKRSNHIIANIKYLLREYVKVHGDKISFSEIEAKTGIDLEGFLNENNTTEKATSC